MSEQSMFKPGDVVGLKSGGPPWTVISAGEASVHIGAMNTGGLWQETVVTVEAVERTHARTPRLKGG